MPTGLTCSKPYRLQKEINENSIGVSTLLGDVPTQVTRVCIPEVSLHVFPCPFFLASLALNYHSKSCWDALKALKTCYPVFGDTPKTSIHFSALMKRLAPAGHHFSLMAEMAEEAENTSRTAQGLTGSGVSLSGGGLEAVILTKCYNFPSPNHVFLLSRIFFSFHFYSTLTVNINFTTIFMKNGHLYIKRR